MRKALCYCDRCKTEFVERVKPVKLSKNETLGTIDTISHRDKKLYSDFNYRSVIFEITDNSGPEQQNRVVEFCPDCYRDFNNFVIEMIEN